MESKFHSVELVRTKLAILRTCARALQARARGARETIYPSSSLFLSILYWYPDIASYQVQRCPLRYGQTAVYAVYKAARYRVVLCTKFSIGM